jgi:hypothetical protein
MVEGPYVIFVYSLVLICRPVMKIDRTEQDHIERRTGEESNDQKNVTRVICHKSDPMG